MSYKLILVPVDGSETSARGLSEAVRLSKDTGAKLRLLHVVDEYLVFATPELGMYSNPVLESLRGLGAKTLESVAGVAKAAGAATESVLLESAGSRVADLIVAEAARAKADLIVMGTHGRRGIKRALIGSDAELVMRYSPVPVMLVPPGRVRARGA